MDSRYILHHLLTQKIPFETVSYRYDGMKESDSLLPQQLAAQFGFKHEVVDVGYKVLDSNTEDTVLGSGRTRSKIRKGIISGTFAGVTAKAFPYVSYDRNCNEGNRYASQFAVFQNYPIHEIMERYKTSIRESGGENPAHCFRRWSIKVNSLSFMMWIRDIELCRTAFFFRGTRHMPFTDAGIIDLSYRYPANIDPLHLYRHGFDTWLKEMKIVPIRSGAIPSVVSSEDIEDKLVFQKQNSRLREMATQDQLLTKWFPQINPEDMPTRFRTFLYHFGAWETRFSSSA